MGIGYYPKTIYGLYVGEVDYISFLAEHGYTLDEDLLDEYGVEAITKIPGLEKFKFFSADSGGYSSNFGVLCSNKAQGKKIFDKAFPNLYGAEFQKIVEIL